MPRGYETFEDVAAVGETEKAVLVDFDGEQHWVPKSQIHEDSEVQAKGDEGDLDVTLWWAQQVGLR